MDIRLSFADNIRTLLICQVIAVHAAVTYGAEGGWYVSEPGADSVTSVVLTLFNAVSQSYFMSLLFLLAGFFCVHSLQRTSVAGYMLNRLKRLGIPLLTFYLVIGPVTIWLACRIEDSPPPPYWTTLHAGPMWFAQALLIFTALYLIWRALFSRLAFGKGKYSVPFSWFSVVLFTLLMWLVSIPARALWPMGEGIAGMQLGSFGHYGLMFTVGLTAAQLDWQSWLAAMPSKTLTIAVTVGFLLLPVGLALGYAEPAGFMPFMGGLYWQSLFYTAWESAMCVLISLRLLRSLQKPFSNAQLWQKMGRANYAVYFIHPPVLVGVSGLLLNIELPAAVKFLMATAVCIAVCFPLAWLLTRLPVIRQIL